MRILAALLFSLATALGAVAQAQDLPIRVGRIAHIEGAASVYQDAEYGWEKAYINTPITSENSVWTDQGSRAELRVSGMAIRLDRLTQFDVARLDEDELDAFVARGSVALRVRHHENNERLTFSTPNARVRIRQDGRYRIDVDPDRFETRVTVFAGEARIGTDDGRIRVGPGRSVLVFGSDPPEFVEQAAGNDGFDRWVLARDERWREGRATTYVSTYMTGYEDLDMYGEWAMEPEYGALWYPRQVSAGWAPYRYGRWDYVRPWGWTWIDDAPWGYAPFHYGRWVYVRDRWAWHPGERIARPVWAPALVAWVGGSSWSVGVSSGGPSVGWYPLSPWDRYDPWFQASPTYVQRVNVVVRDAPTREDPRRWRERTRERGTTVADRRALVEQRPVQQALVRVPVETIRQAQVVTRPEAVLPTRNDVLARRRQQPRPAVPTPVAPPAVAQSTAPRQSGERQQQPPAGRSAIVRPDFGRSAVVATPRQASAPPAERGNSPLARETQREQERSQAARVRESQAQERAHREQQQAQQKAQREQQQAQQKTQREQEQAQRQAQERAQREQQQAQQKVQREQQQAQQKAQRDQEQAQRQAQERAQREQQQAQQKAQRDQQQAQQKAQRDQEQAQRQAQERAQREQQQAQQKAQREQQQAQQKAQRDQQQAQRQAQERAQREQQQAQQKAQREQEQSQRQAQERAQREQQQAQQRQQAQQQQAQQQQAPQQQPLQRQRGHDKDDDDDKGKGKGKDKDKP